MTREEYNDFANALKNNYTIDFDKLPEFCDMAISALSENKGDLIHRIEVESVLHNNLHALISTDQLDQLYKDINHLHTYSFPDTAKPEEGAELIDRRQIKWYGCDHEGHIKGINCETADCSKCFFATVEHDEVMSLPVYPFPNSAENKGEWIPVSERLPEIHQDVLLELRSGEMLTGFKAETEPYFYCNGVDGCYVEFQNVLAWQPLPKPYKAEKGGE